MKAPEILVIILFSILQPLTINVPVFAEFGTDRFGENLDIHGFLSQGFLKSEHNNFYAGTQDGTFQFNEFGINFSTDITDRLRTGMQFFSRDLSDIGNNTLTLDWAHGDYRWQDWLGVRVGKLRIPYGFYNDIRDFDMLRTAIFLPSSLYPEAYRDIVSSLYGVELYGYVDISLLGNVSYQLLYGERDVSTDSSMSKDVEEISNDLLLIIQELNVKEFRIASLEWDTPVPGFRIKSQLGSYEVHQTLEVDSLNFHLEEFEDGELLFPDTTKNNFYVVSGEYQREHVTITAEYVSFDTDVEEPIGYYVSLSVPVTQWWEVGGYYSVEYYDKNDRAGEYFVSTGQPDYRAWRKEWVLSSRFNLNEFWTFKIEGHLVNGAASFFVNDNPDGLEEESFLFAVKTTYHF